MAEDELGEILHHVVLMRNETDDQYPIGIGLADESNDIIAYVPLDLKTANEIGERFCELYNDALIRARGDV